MFYVSQSLGYTTDPTINVVASSRHGDISSGSRHGIGGTTGMVVVVVGVRVKVVVDIVWAIQMTTITCKMGLNCGVPLAWFHN